MPMSKLTVFAFAGLAAFATFGAMADDPPTIVVDPGIAAMSVDELVAARQAAMKQDGMVLKGASTLTGADAVAAATTLVQNFTNFPSLFPEGSVNDKSHALPIIWTEFDKFTANFDKDKASAQAMLVAATAGDAAGYAAAIKEIGSSCGECHMTYRSK